MIRLRVAAWIVLTMVVAGCASPPKAEPPRDEPRVTYRANDADFMTVLEEIVRQGNLSFIREAEFRYDGSMAAKVITSRSGAPFWVVVDADATRGIGTASVHFDAISAREALSGLAKAFGLAISDHSAGIVRLSKP